MKNDSEYLAQLEKDVVLAYKKLKSYVYHENVSLRLRMDVARFETTEIDEKLSTIALDLFEYENNSKSLDAYLNKIRCSLYPKYFESENIDTREEFYFSNLNKQKNYTISGSKSVTAFIECPVEIHIMCVLWIMRIGESLDDELSSSCYANRLQRDSDNEFSTSSIKLFKRYYDNYNSWRDDAIKKAKSLHKLNLDVAILNLDIQSYYNSVDIDVRSLKAHKPDAWLNDALFKVHDVYRKVLVKLDLIDDPRKKILPIGLLSSNILSNYYLRKLDAAVTSTIKPEFYGRYVDDILLVFSNPRINPTAKSPATEFILETLCNAKNWKSPKEVQISRVRKSNEFQIRINTNSLKFQLSKVKLYHFFSSESINVLEEFENEIKRNSSEFKFQPESEEIFESFEKSSYSISYSDTINKLRSIEGFNTNKFGASKHLSKLITATKFVGSLDKEKMEEINFRIREFFTGRRALELNSLWEKVFTFYVINKAKDDLISYSKEIIQTVLNIQFKINGKVNAELTKTIKSTLLDHLGNCFAMAAALDGNFFTKSVIDGVRESNGKGIVSQHLKDITLPNIQNRASKLIDSNLFRHNYSFYPLFNYCNQYETFSYVNWMNFNEADYEISTHKIKFSPRFIHFHELELFYSLKNWFGKFQKSELEEYTENKLSFVKDRYLQFNNLEGYSDSYTKQFPIKFEPEEGKNYETIKVKSRYSNKYLKFGLVNMKVDEMDSLSSLESKPNLDLNRLDKINHVLNQAIKNKCDIIVFPEISIPLQFITVLTDFVKRNQIAVVCGFEHFTNSNSEAFNYVAVMLPFQYNSYNNVLLDFRLKIDYSHEETEQIIGRGMHIPKMIESESLRLYSWKNVWFSVFNCFELADINKRGQFRGEVDFVVSVEHNRDVNYFSNIIESVARDIHAFIIQVNANQYGDSRITFPSESHSKDIIKIKGGYNVALITGSIDISSLRKFQKLKYSLQKINKTFKPTPPNFSISKYRKL